MSKARILWLYSQDTGVGYYRARLQARLAEAMGYEVKFFNQPFHRALQPKQQVKQKNLWVDVWLRENVGKFDLIMVDRATSDEEWGRWAGYRHFSEGCRMVVDFDDLFTGVPWWNPAEKKYQPGQLAREAGLRHMRNAELTTVSTKQLGKAVEEQAHAVRVLHNRIDLADWEGLKQDPEREGDRHVRVLYGGAGAHFGDLEEARAGLETAIRKQWVPWRLVCMGTVPDWLQDLSMSMPKNVVCLPWVSFEDYSKVVAWGGFDFAIGPLKDDPFNRCKSNIKWLEATAQGLPLLCSDVGPYEESIPEGCALKVDNTPVQWAEAMRAMLTDSAMRTRIHGYAEEAVRGEWVIDKGREELQIVIEEALARPRIESLEDTRLPGDVPVVQPGAVPPGRADSAEVALGGPDCDDPPAGTAGNGTGRQPPDS